MSDYTELKRLATRIVEVQTSQDVPISKLFDDFDAATSPEVVLALIAENERLVPFEEAYATACNVRNRLIKENELLDRLVVTNKALSDSFRAERDQLRAEVAGLRTGYEAYEQVNAELKAEVEGLRKYGEEFAVLAERRREEVEALRKDSESYRLLSFCHGQGTLQLVRSHHELCAEIRRLKILAGEPVPPTPEEFIGPSPEGPTARIRRKMAALVQGEQS